MGFLERRLDMQEAQLGFEETARRCSCTKPTIFHNIYYATSGCKRNIEMTPPCKVEETVQPGAIVDNKRLSAVLEQIKAQQAGYPARHRRGHVARQRPPNNLEAPGLPSKGRAPRHGATVGPA